MIKKMLKSHPRRHTLLVLAALDEGRLSLDQVATAALNWLPDSDVAELIEADDWGLLDDEEEVTP
jgi:hypothetical protein